MVLLKIIIYTIFSFIYTFIYAELVFYLKIMHKETYARVGIRVLHGAGSTIRVMYGVCRRI